MELWNAEERFEGLIGSERSFRSRAKHANSAVEEPRAARESKHGPVSGHGYSVFFGYCNSQAQSQGDGGERQTDEDCIWREREFSVRVSKPSHLGRFVLFAAFFLLVWSIFTP